MTVKGEVHRAPPKDIHANQNIVRSSRSCKFETGNVVEYRTIPHDDAIRLLQADWDSYMENVLIGGYDVRR